MRLKSLKGKLLLAVSALVISSGLLISLLATQRYSSNLFETMAAHAENLAHAVALESTDKILINDLVALQKTLNHHISSHHAISYLFIHRDNQVLAHTFPKGFPVELLKANEVVSGSQMHFQKIASRGGEDYLDIAWPVLEGKAGVLRLGLSEKPYRRQVRRLWFQMSFLTLAILFLAIGGSLVFVRRITNPLTALAQATQRVDNADYGVRVQVRGQDEVARLAASFNHMVARIAEYTQRLEEQNMELERAQHQTRTFCGIVQEIGALRNLHEIGSFLIKRFQDILKCNHMVLLIFSRNRDLIFVLSEKGAKALEKLQGPETVLAKLEDLKQVTFTTTALLKPPILPHYFQATARQAIVPLRHENQLLGALVVGCPGECQCSVKEVDTVGLILSQAAGVIKRAMFQEEEIRDFRSRVETSAEYGGIIGKDPKMQLIYKLIEDIAPTDATVLIQGESGTGKELVAHAMHQKSTRKEKPFIVINCSAYPATLLESELFGHERGAFTGAIRRKIGRFEQAHGGTVFLDEIGEIAPSAQIKLLRVLQTQKFERLGGEQTLSVDVRILAATNKDLLREVKRGYFREDLFYRLNVIPIQLPPLRERYNDIPLLAGHFLRRFSLEQGKKINRFSPEAMRLLLDYSWPGNVRELENSIEHGTVLAKGDQIEASDLPAALHTVTSLAHSPRTMSDHERDLLQDTLQECGWNKKEAARRLGISRNTLYVKLKKYQISRPTTH